MRYPFDKLRLGTRYGEPGESWKCGWHSGLDLTSVAAGGDGLVYPLYKGEVTKVGRSGSYGNCVYVRHPDGYVTLYAHLKTVYVKAGMEVNEKTVLGVEGATGNASGRHLHIEVHKGSYKYPAGIDPLEFIRRSLEECDGNARKGIRRSPEGGDGNARKGIKERLEVEKKIKIRLNGVVKTVTATEKNGHYRVELQDLRDEKISVGYDAKTKMPVVEVVG